MLKAAEIFQNNMIIQRDKPVILWGQASPGAEVAARIQGKTGETKTDPDGNWMLSLPSLETSLQETLVINSGEDVLTFENIAVGEVWVAAGQSNMEFHMRYEKHRKEEFALPPNPNLRFFDVPEVSYDGQKEDFDYSAMGVWRQAGEKDGDYLSLEYFSAVGYYFQKELEQDLHVPVGIIGCNWGGTPSCAWISKETVEKAGHPWIQDYEDQTRDMDMDNYWEMQRTNPLNGRGTPFSDPFGEFALAGTPSQEEINEKLGIDGEEVPEYFTMLHSESMPGALYEHMVKTIAPFGIRGVLWYQGESDDVPGRQSLYKDMLLGLMKDWRGLWADENLPFLIVQLPGWDHWLGSVNQDYAAIRRCQQQAVDASENSWLCSISDGGQEDDIHPKDKKIVGHRLALLARGHIYGEDVLCDAPKGVSAALPNNRHIEITFENAGNGLNIRTDTEDHKELSKASDATEDSGITESSGKIEGLEVIVDGVPADFDAKVMKDKLVLTLKTPVKEQAVIRFAKGKWYKVNLYNSAHIPAVPFEFTIHCV